MESSSSPGAGQNGRGGPGPELRVETEWEAHRGSSVAVPPTLALAPVLSASCRALAPSSGRSSPPLGPGSRALDGGSVVKKKKICRPMQEMWVQSLGWADPLQEGMATHSSILAYKIPWTEEPGRLQSVGLLIQTPLRHQITTKRGLILPLPPGSSCVPVSELGLCWSQSVIVGLQSHTGPLLAGSPSQGPVDHPRS